MQLTRRGEGAFHSPPAPNAPVAEVLVGGVDGGPDVAVVRLTIPVTSGLRPHRHGGSDVVLMPMGSAVEIDDGVETMRVEPGDAILIAKDEEVALSNPGDQPVEVPVVAGPANFAAHIRSWPTATTT